MTLCIAPDFVPEEHYGPSRLKKARQCPTAECLHYVVGLREPKLPWAEVEALPEPVEPKKPPTDASAGVKAAYAKAKKAYAKAKKAYNKTLRPALGTEGHARLEAYYKGEAVNWYDRAGKTMLAGLHYLPIAKNCAVIEPEQRITLDLSYLHAELPELIDDPLLLQGTRDLCVQADASAWSAEFVPPSFERAQLQWILIDHKTTLTFDFFDRDKTMKTVRTPDELRADEQVNMYGLQVMQSHDLEELQCRWVYYRTEDAPDARAVDVRITRAGAEAIVRDLVIEALRLRALHRQKRPWEAYEKDFDSCPNYGGCIYDKENGGPCPGAAAESMGAKLVRLRRKQKVAAAVKTLRELQPKPEKKARPPRMAFAKAAAAAGITKTPTAPAPKTAQAPDPEPQNAAEAQEPATEAPVETPAPTPAPAAAKPKATRKGAVSHEGVTGSYNGVSIELPPTSPLAAAIVKAVEAKQAYDAALNGE